MPPLPVVAGDGGRSVARTRVPTIFWHSEGQVGGSTVLALGGGLNNTLIHICSKTKSGRSQCQTVIPYRDISWDGSIKFRLPGDPVVLPWSFRACAGSADNSEESEREVEAGALCSAWHTINIPALWWAQGDASSGPAPRVTGDSTGWLRAYGRSLGIDSSGSCSPSMRDSISPAQATKAILVDLADASRTCVLETQAASCYDTTFGMPACATPGNYTLQILAQDNSTNDPPIGGLMDLSFGGKSIVVEVVPPRPWSSRRFVVPVGGNISAALAAANAAGGGLVTLSTGVYQMGATSIELGDGVQLVGSADGPSVLRWGQPTSKPLLANLRIGGTHSQPMNETLEVSHFACDNGATWSFDNSTQQMRFDQ